VTGPDYGQLEAQRRKLIAWLLTSVGVVLLSAALIGILKAGSIYRAMRTLSFPGL